MDKKNYKDPDTFDEEYVKKTRTFPRGKAALLTFCIIAQVLLILFAALYQPKPQDVIKEYCVEVTPKSNGSLDIQYSFVWNALDTDEPLTWVDIGMANRDFKIYQDSLSDNIKSAQRYTEDDYVSTRIYFDREYSGGGTLSFSFTINQKGLLHESKNGYYYAFVPGWFNATPVENYKFLWEKTDTQNANATGTEGNYLVWEGTMTPGTYVKMNVTYGENAFFPNPRVSPYQSFNTDGIYNELQENKVGVIMIAILAFILIGIGELYIVDCFVSYHRGRGFMTGYGYHVHLYGRSNPRYVRERDAQAQMARTRGYGGRGGGGGCACACACACAGGGRAGCSQKDTYTQKKQTVTKQS